MEDSLLTNNALFSEALYAKMRRINPATRLMELFEFRYALENVTPQGGWHSVTILPAEKIEQRVNDRSFYSAVAIKPKKDGRLVLDEQILHLLQMLFVGLVSEVYPAEWINQHFYFDVRGFFFLHRTVYYTPNNLEMLYGAPYRTFEKKQKALEDLQSVGYRAFKTANEEIDRCFIEIVHKWVALKGVPLIIAIAGQTAAGKTEISARLHDSFKLTGNTTTTFEMDNFFKDRDYREAHGIDSMGKEALHYPLLQGCLADLCRGKRVFTPRYDFIQGTSSHDLEGVLKPGGHPVDINPAEIIFREGNYPFLLPEIAPLIGLKIVYLTDDAVRLKRKWKRDMDYRKKYDLYYLLNRYFREQFLMAEAVYKPQIELCDILIDTTQATLWVKQDNKDCFR